MSSTPTDPAKGYLPPLRLRSLTRVYDSVIGLTTREAAFKRALLDRAELQSGQRVLDVGCGTGTLVAMAARREPGLRLTGIDPDAEALAAARAKTRGVPAEIRFDHGSATELPYGDAGFDAVLSTLAFHHLRSEEKRRAVEEAARVLGPSGKLYVADFGRAASPVARLAFSLVVRALDGFERTRINAEGRLPELFERCGFAEVEELDRFPLPYGTICLHRAVRRA